MTSPGIKIEGLASELSDYFGLRTFFYRPLTIKGPHWPEFPPSVAPPSNEKPPSIREEARGLGGSGQAAEVSLSGGGSVLVVGPSTPCRFDPETDPGLHADGE